MNIDYIKVLANSALHFVFFAVNILLLPNVIFKGMERFKNKTDELPGWVKMILWFFPSLINQGIDIILKRPIMFITGNKIQRHTIKAPNGAETYTLTYQAASWYIPWKQFGVYVCDLITVFVNPLISILLLYLMLPTTFKNVCNGISGWVSFLGAHPNLDLLKNMAEKFKAIAWDGLIIGGLEENFIFLALWLVLVIFIFGFMYIPLSIKILADVNGERVEQRLANVDFRCLPTVAALFVAFNFATAFINYDLYHVISSAMNSFGMVILFVTLVELALWTVILCSDFIIEKVTGVKKKD